METILEKELIINDSAYAISGVIQDIPENIHFDFDLALNILNLNNWGARTYIQLSEASDPTDVFDRINAQVSAINRQLATDELFNGFIFQPVSSIHLNSDLLYEMKPPGDVRYLYAFGFISSIILLITSTN